MTMTVSALTDLLFDYLSRENVAQWDNCGLLVGNPSVEVTGVYLALDPTFEAIDATVESGANVLLTHHPVILDGVTRVVSDELPAALLFYAISKEVALVAMHTNLDRTPRAQERIAMLLGLDYLWPLEPVREEGDRMGQVGRIPLQAQPLESFALRVGEVFGVSPRVWGSPAQPVSLVANATGSATSMIPVALQHPEKVDVLIGGEFRYHDALLASQQGLALIEVGHDASENILLYILRDILVDDAGVDIRLVHLHEPKINWWTSTLIDN